MDFDSKLIANWNQSRGDKKPSQRLVSWNWFKSYIIKNPELRRKIEPWKEMEIGIFPTFARTKNKKKNFWAFLRQFWRMTLDPSLSFSIEDDDFGGVKIISKTNSWIELKESLIGQMESPPTEAFDKLIAAHYTSLFRDDVGNQTILFGPLSFINHACDSDVVFDTVTMTCIELKCSMATAKIFMS
eukprot:TRINITY_DN2519_c0_g1_i6.p1 TRINITY_DN2519_c0_g1~~TRINITY_DN2519_c0_g1_i6.p1  ORF type:complete len:186 (+),score=50.27 TRINITY_DN2519_c0_g1_i6:104-661(+)